MASAGGLPGGVSTTRGLGRAPCYLAWSDGNISGNEVKRLAQRHRQVAALNGDASRIGTQKPKRRDGGAGHPRLGAREHPAVAALLRARGDARDVRAGVRLRQREGRHLLAAQGRDEVAAAQLLAAVLVDEVRPHE